MVKSSMYTVRFSRYGDRTAWANPDSTPPPTAASSPRAPDRSRRPRAILARRRTLNTATSSSTAETSRSRLRPRCSTSAEVSDDPTIPPMVPPAAMKPNSRRLCSLLNTSARKPQNTDTTKRLKTAAQM